MAKESYLQDIFKEEESLFSKLHKMTEQDKILLFWDVIQKDQIIQCLFQHVCAEINDYGESELLMPFGFEKRRVNMALLAFTIQKGKVFKDGAFIYVSLLLIS